MPSPVFEPDYITLALTAGDLEPLKRTIRIAEVRIDARNLDRRWKVRGQHFFQQLLCLLSVARSSVSGCKFRNKSRIATAGRNTLPQRGNSIFWLRTN